MQKKQVCGYSHYVAALGRLADSTVSQSERPTDKPKHISVVVCRGRGTQKYLMSAISQLVCFFPGCGISSVSLARLFCWFVIIYKMKQLAISVTQTSLTLACILSSLILNCVMAHYCHLQCMKLDRNCNQTRKYYSYITPVHCHPQHTQLYAVCLFAVLKYKRSVTLSAQYQFMQKFLVVFSSF